MPQNRVPRISSIGEGITRPEAGFALLLMLVIMIVISGTSVSFIGFMNRAQTYSGDRYRARAAMAVAESGVHRALQIFESTAPNGTDGRTWRPAGFSELLRGSIESRFTLSAVEEPDGAIMITSTGEVAGTVRHLRARIYLASPVLLAGLTGWGTVMIEKPPATLDIVPYARAGVDRPWVHVLAGEGLWLENDNVAMNTSKGPNFESGPGEGRAARRTTSTNITPPDPIRIIVGPRASLKLAQRQVAGGQLRPVGAPIDRVSVVESFATRPTVDRVFYRALASSNMSNAEINNAAGKYVGDSGLTSKFDSLYTAMQFEKLQLYLRTESQRTLLRGVVYVTGGVSLAEADDLRISDGALVTEGMLQVGPRSSLRVSHSPATRTLPGLIVLDSGLIVRSGALLEAQGLVLSEGAVEGGDGAKIDIVGALVSMDAGLSFRNQGTHVVIRYDPAVLGTPGLVVQPDSPVVAWVATWEELEGPAPATPTAPLVGRSETQPRSKTVPPAAPPPSPVWSPTRPQIAGPVSPSPQPAETVPTPRFVGPRRPLPAERAVTPANPNPANTIAVARPSRMIVARAAAAPRAFMVQAGAFAIRENARQRTAALRRDGFAARTVIRRGLYKILVGAYDSRALAQKEANRLRARGYAVIVVP